MDQVAQNTVRVVDDLSRANSFDIGDEPDSAAIVLVRRIVEAMLLRRPVQCSRSRPRRSGKRPRLPARGATGGLSASVIDLSAVESHWQSALWRTSGTQRLWRIGVFGVG